MRSWVVVLTPITRVGLETCADYLTALSGLRHVISDYDLYTTLALLDTAGLLGAFHSIIERGPRRAADPRFLRNLSRRLSRGRGEGECVYIDSDAGAVVAAKLKGWRGCLGASPPPTKGILKDTRRSRRSESNRPGRGVWCEQRFASLHRALRYYIFGT